MEYSGEQFDIIVVGAGIMGSSTAYQTAKRGLKTLLLEQFDFLHHRGSSHGESRTLRATYPEDYYSAMVVESSRLWEEAEAEIGYKVYFKTSQFDMGHREDKSLLAVISSCRKNSIHYRVLDRRQVRQYFSGRIELPENWIGLVTDLGGVIKPTKAVSMYQTLAHKHKAVLKDHMEVVDIKKDDERGGILVCTTNGDRFWGKKCVLTAGAWIKNLVKRVTGFVLPIQPLESAVCYWKIKEGHQDDFTIKAGFPTFASYGQSYAYGSPSLEFPGLIKIPLHGGRPCEPENRTWSLTPVTLEPLREWIQGRFGDLVDSSGPIMIQSCMYSMSPDEDFVIDFLGGELGKDVVIAGGFSGHGFKMAPVVGRLLADIVLTGEANGVVTKYFSIERFKESPKGNVKDFEEQVKLNDFTSI